MADHENQQSYLGCEGQGWHQPSRRVSRLAKTEEREIPDHARLLVPVGKTGTTMGYMKNMANSAIGVTRLEEGEGVVKVIDQATGGSESVAQVELSRKM